MVALQLRDVPESIRDDLARAAQAEGKSLQAFLREMVEREARKARSREFLSNLSPMPVEGPTITRAEIVEIIRQGREERDRSILGSRYPEGDS